MQSKIKDLGTTTLGGRISALRLHFAALALIFLNLD